MTAELDRIAAAVAVLLCYVGLCLLVAWRHRSRQRRAADGRAAPATGDAVLIAFASQTGFAEQLAVNTSRALRAAGVPARLLSFQDLSEERLRRTSRALFVASTTGEGDAPDSAASFAGRIMRKPVLLSGLSYGLLAAGDREYRNFCGFGRQLDSWLQDNGATPLFPRVEVDDGDTEALVHWRQLMVHVGAPGTKAAWEDPGFTPWMLAERRVLNAGSAGDPAFLIALQPPTANIAWQAGDIAEIEPCNDAAHKTREYSIASLPADGRLELLVREHRRPDGTLGLGSGWLTRHAPLGSAVSLRIRANSSFHAPQDDRPMILIGNGTGMAGLRAHLKARIAAGRCATWLLFGERSRMHDFFFRDEIESWRRAGHLARLDLAFSRDPPQRVYVQDCLRREPAMLRDWIARGASVFVCGSIDGMASGVNAALVDLLGREAVDRLRQDGRYRRDVY